MLLRHNENEIKENAAVRFIRGKKVQIEFGMTLYHSLLMCVCLSEEWSDYSGTSKDAQPSAGAEEGRGDSPQNQSDAARPTKQVESESGCRTELCLATGL